jgi:hypothetical protein
MIVDRRCVWEFCEFHLHGFPTHYSEADLHRVLKRFISHQFPYHIGEEEQGKNQKLIEAVYTQFLRKHGISADLRELIDKPAMRRDRRRRSDDLEEIGSNPHLTDEALHQVIIS